MGNTDYYTNMFGVLRDHPHLRGEYFNFASELLTGDRITPTCVGNTEGISPGSNYNKDHPHLRGEYEKNKEEKMTKDRITPTCVGNTFLVAR